ncbi:hypothetical protein M1373_00905 [Candidatus Marsarchaeota archaeon]|nr:hypothetical protein [Candidatus Marsarchaeota archaeon]MCL5404226.1 hypothetical protein [Candidatus Marsarchaeota archaeon]
MRKSIDKDAAARANTLIFVAVSIILLFFLVLYYDFIYLSGTLSYIADALMLLYIFYMLVFAFCSDSRLAEYAGAGVIAAFAALCTAFIMILAGFHDLIFIREVASFEIVLYTIMLPTIVILLFGFYMIRKKPLGDASKYLAAIMIVIALVVFFSYQLYAFKLGKINSDDEMALAYYAFKALAAHTNIYSINISGILATNYTSYGFTLLTNNSVVGRFDYPALFMLVEAPFYAVFSGTARAIMENANTVSYLVFMLVAAFAFCYTVPKERLDRLWYLAPAILLFISFFIQIASPQYFLMLALLIIMLLEIDSKYVWVWMGLAASLQEILWVPIVLAVAYIYSRHGAKHTAKMVGAAVLLFLAINAYFIAQSPSTYIGAVFKPVNGALLPYYLSPFPQLLQRFYPISIGGMSVLFYIAILISILVVLYSRNLIAILAMSAVCYFVLYHALVVYYAMFIAIIPLALIIDKSMPVAARAKRTAMPLRRHRAAFYFALGLCIAGIALAVIAYHAAYESNFGISAKVYGITMHNGSTYALLNISNEGPKVQNVSILAFYFYNGSSMNIEGLSVSNLSTITNMSSCNAQCQERNPINYNILHLNGTGYRVKLAIPVYAGNRTSVSCFIYKEGYAYECRNIFLG